MTGPFGTSQETARASLWERRGRAWPIGDANAAQLAEALSGIQVTDYERRVLALLAGDEPSTVTVICGWIERARRQRASCPEPGREVNQ